MQRKMWTKGVIFMIIPLMMFAVSCGKKKVPPSTPEPQVIEDDSLANSSLEDDTLENSSALEEERLAEEAARAQEAARQLFLQDRVYFAFDSSLLDKMAQDVLKRKVEWLRNNPEENVLLEGHCDERGTNDYNIALGDRRANSVRTFLVDLGINASRMSTISYGEERLADPSNHAKNRRVQFVIE